MQLQMMMTRFQKGKLKKMNEKTFKQDKSLMGQCLHRTFGPPIEAPHAIVRYYQGKPYQTFKAPRLTVESVYVAPETYTTRTANIFNSVFSPSELEDYSGASSNIVSAVFILVAAIFALVF